MRDRTWLRFRHRLRRHGRGLVRHAAIHDPLRRDPFRDPQLGPLCNDVLDHPSERKGSSDRHYQHDDHDWKHDEDKHPESRQHVSTSPALLRGSHPFPATAITLEVRSDIDCVARFLKQGAHNDCGD